MDVWRQDWQRALPAGGYAVDGWRLRTLWLGPKRHALGVLPQRIYLRTDGGRDERPEREIVNVRRQRQRPLQERLRGLTWFLRRLQECCGKQFGDPVSLVASDPDPLNGVTLLGSRATFSADANHRVVHEQGGFYSAPNSLEVLVCCDEGVTRTPATDYAHRARDEFARRGLEANLRDVTLDQLEARLDELDRGGIVKRRDVPVLFMLAGKEERLSGRLSHVMRRLERHRLPWRRAYATDDRTWSVSDQTGSLLQAASGHPHAVVPARGGCLPWSIGIDLSHRGTSSRVAASLVSPDGRLSGNWTLDQARQENIESAVLRRLLVAAACEIPAGDRSSGLLVVRDGRVFESEDVGDYRRELGGPVTLVEIRKNGNPPLLLGNDARVPNRPVVGWLPEAVGGSLGFLVALPNLTRAEFGSVLKIWMPQAWDGMRLGPERLICILFAQTLTPGLGLGRRRLPAPVYWADGIAGASDDDLRFRGQLVVELN